MEKYKFSIKEISKEEINFSMIKAFYNYYEMLYGKTKYGAFVKKYLDNGQKISDDVYLNDSNYILAITELEKVFKDPTVQLMGSYIDDKLTAISKVHFSKNDGKVYQTVAGVMFIDDKYSNFDKIVIYADIIRTFELAAEKVKSVNVLSFESPVNDKEFTQALELGNYFSPMKNNLVIAYDKEINKNLER